MLPGLSVTPGLPSHRVHWLVTQPRLGAVAVATPRGLSSVSRHETWSVLPSPDASCSGNRRLIDGLALWPTLGVLVALSFLAAGLSAVAGFGGGMLFLPLLTATVGPEHAVPVLTIMLLMATPSRTYMNRHHLRWRKIGWFALGSTLGAVVGAEVFLSLPVFWLRKAIGGFLILSVVAAHLPGRRLTIKGERVFAAVGVGGGFVGGVVGGVGPMVSPFFLAAGLTGPAFVGTLAACAIWMHIVKLFVYERGGALGLATLSLGAVLGLAMVLGTYAGTKLLRRLDARKFTILVEALLVLLGAWLLVAPKLR